MQVTVRVMRGIQDGTYRPGQRLTQRQLEKNCSVGRTPTKEALFVLAGEGWVRHDLNRGFMVATLGKQDVTKLYTLRRPSYRWQDPKETGEQAEACLNDMETAEAAVDWHRLDECLHQAMASSALRLNLPLLMDAAARRLNILCNAYRRCMSLDGPLREQLQREHHEIQDAWLRGEKAEADRLLAAHVQDEMHRLAEFVGNYLQSKR